MLAIGLVLEKRLLCSSASKSQYQWERYHSHPVAMDNCFLLHKITFENRVMYVVFHNFTVIHELGCNLQIQDYDTIILHSDHC